MVWAGSSSKNNASDIDNGGSSLAECSVRMRQLKRTGLSKFYSSKSQSFSSLELALSSQFGDSAAALSKRPSALSLDLERTTSGSSRGCASGASNNSTHSGRAFSSECGGSSPQSSYHTDDQSPQRTHDWLLGPSLHPVLHNQHHTSHSAHQSFRHPTPSLHHSQSLNSHNPTCHQTYASELYQLHGCYDSVCEATEDICAALRAASLLTCGSTGSSERSSYARSLSYHSTSIVGLPCTLEHCEMGSDE